MLLSRKMQNCDEKKSFFSKQKHTEFKGQTELAKVNTASFLAKTTKQLYPLEPHVCILPM